MSDILEMVDRLIGNVLAGNIYSDTDKFAPMSQAPAPSQARFADIVAVGHWLRNISGELGATPRLGLSSDAPRRPENIVKGLNFVASQFFLASLNKSDKQLGAGNNVWNPLSLLATLPGLGTFGSTHVTKNPGVYNIPAQKENERLVQLVRGTYIERNPVEQLIQNRPPESGFHGDISKVGKYDDIQTPRLGPTIEGAIDSSDALAGTGVHTNLYSSKRPYTPTMENAVVPLEEMFQRARSEPSNPQTNKLSEMFTFRPHPGSSVGPLFPSDSNGLTSVVRPGISRGVRRQTLRDAPGINAAVTDVAFNAIDQEEGVLDKVIEESDIYMPFMFQDLRDPVDKFLYFRAFLKGTISETFTPDWQLERYYGRVDQIPIYQGTIRNLNFAFDVVAWSPKDLRVMYKKLQKLQSMVYPLYDTRGFLSSGPIIRVRIGDLIASKQGRGLPGFITSMDWSYDDGIWNIEDKFKVPRKVLVSIGLTVLHDGNPGVYPLKSRTERMGDEENTTTTTDGTIFGSGRFDSLDNGQTTEIKVSEAEIRRIFETVKK